MFVTFVVTFVGATAFQNSWCIYGAVLISNLLTLKSDFHWAKSQLSSKADEKYSISNTKYSKQVRKKLNSYALIKVSYQFLAQLSIVNIT